MPFKCKVQKTIAQMNNIINEAKNTQNGDRLCRRKEKKKKLYFKMPAPINFFFQRQVKAKFWMPFILPGILGTMCFVIVAYTFFYWYEILNKGGLIIRKNRGRPHGFL